MFVFNLEKILNCMHCHLRMEIFCPNRNVNIIFFCQLTTISVIALLNAIAEAVSDNRELTRVFHHIISSDFRVIATDLLDTSTPHETCLYMLLNKETCSLI